MSRFANKKCPICHAPFTEKADIVVCPECGTPHHRQCYLAKGHCGVEEYHAQGFVWNGLLPDEEAAQPEQTAQQPEPAHDPHRGEYPAGVPNPEPRPEFRGMDKIQDPEEYYKRFQMLVTDDVRGDDGVSLHELCAFAAKSVYHYGRAFSTFRGEITGRKSSVFMNICSGMFLPVHQFYRKMDCLGVATLLITVLFMLPELLISGGIIDLESLSDAGHGILSMIYMACNFGSLLLTVMLWLFGDYLYYKHAVRQIKKIRSRFEGNLGEEYYAALVEKGRPSWLRAVVGFLLLAFVTACIRYLPALLV